MDRKELNDLVEEPFNVPGLAQLWPDILQCHRDMGFQLPLTDKEKGNVLTDNEMVSEFQWIYGQYRKFIGTKRGPWTAMADDLEALLENIMATLGKESETPADRTTLIYQKMRNQWLVDTWNHFAWMLEQTMEENDE